MTKREVFLDTVYYYYTRSLQTDPDMASSSCGWHAFQGLVATAAAAAVHAGTLRVQHHARLVRYDWYGRRLRLTVVALD